MDDPPAVPEQQAKVGRLLGGSEGGGGRNRIPCGSLHPTTPPLNTPTSHWPQLTTRAVVYSAPSATAAHVSRATVPALVAPHLTNLQLNPFATPTIYVRVHNRPSRDSATTHFNGNLDCNSCAGSYAVLVTKNAKPRSGMLLRSDNNTEALTWWLDMLTSTQVFGIHPLTTEDILMQETREKIELFRNYHLACFRSFNQDPYSPTYLEPLNIYIIVFCEGTLSVSILALLYVHSKKENPTKGLRAATSSSRLFGRKPALSNSYIWRWCRDCFGSDMFKVFLPLILDPENGPGTPELETIQHTQWSWNPRAGNYSTHSKSSGQEDADSQVFPNPFVKILSSYSVLEVPAGSEIELEKLATVSKRILVGAASWRLRS
ncbi:hypothetical protein PTTG_08356 [Puccinia triticina 1-1 BBBD Race 1]|uniref:Uncharacterized protein n=1 Tax=Puccinia triticina (isolate 1-1 / race 1 (BBBD)) TaxID=630390 RepID=A0A180GBW1_PUCT1|nr:hypothetical protein PTTG_08356 [Puccinia triticina 1-1 BBBD Race 1]